LSSGSHAGHTFVENGCLRLSSFLLLSALRFVTPKLINRTFYSYTLHAAKR
jgi:hypothetical protein